MTSFDSFRRRLNEGGVRAPDMLRRGEANAGFEPDGGRGEPDDGGRGGRLGRSLSSSYELSWRASVRR